MEMMTHKHKIEFRAGIFRNFPKLSEEIRLGMRLHFHLNVVREDLALLRMSSGTCCVSTNAVHLARHR